MRGISKEMSTAKKQADEAAKNSETAKINISISDYVRYV